MRKRKFTAVTVLAVLLLMLVPFAGNTEAAELRLLGRESAAAYGSGYATIYDKVAAGVAAKAASVTMDVPFESEKVSAVIQLIRADHPEWVWWMGNYSYSYSGDRLKKVELTYTSADGDKFTERAELILKGLDPSASEYEKAKYLHDALAGLIVYDLSASDQSAYTAMTEGKGVCAGYARSYQYLLNRAGISACTVSGTGNGENHAWNIVRLGGKLYLSDVTWDDSEDGMLFYQYFNMPRSRFTDHVPADIFTSMTALVEATDMTQSFFTHDTSVYKTASYTSLVSEGAACGKKADAGGYLRVFVSDPATGTLNDSIQNQQFVNDLFSTGRGVCTDSVNRLSCVHKNGCEVHLRLYNPGATDFTVNATGRGVTGEIKKLTLYVNGKAFDSVLTAKDTVVFGYVPTGTVEVKMESEGFAARTVKTTTRSATADLYLLGDADGTGMINSSDTSALVRCITGSTGKSEYAYSVCDINGDGTVTAADYALLLRHMKNVAQLW